MKTRTKVFGLVLSICLITVMVFGAIGTGAWFTDQEQIAGNSFTAGSLNLELSDPGSVPFSVSNLVPGQSGTKTITLTNSGSIPGTLDISLANIVQPENGITEPEENLNGEYTSDRGELGMFLGFVAFVDVNKNGSFDSGDIQLSFDNQILPYSQISYFAGWRVWENQLAWNNIMTMAIDQSVNLVINYAFPTESQDSNYSQDIAQTDGLSFNIIFDLNQVHTN